MNCQIGLDVYIMLRTILFTAFFAIAFFIAEHYFSSPWLHRNWKVMLVFFLSVSFLTHRLIDTGLQGNREQLVPMYLSATVARLVLGLAFVGFFLYQHVDQRRSFVFDFLVLYICYTGFEIWGLSRNLHRDS